MGVEMQHMDQVMFKHHVEEGRERGIRPAQRASMKIGTSVAARAMRARDAGQATVFPHSLKLVASLQAWRLEAHLAKTEASSPCLLVSAPWR